MGTERFEVPLDRLTQVCDPDELGFESTADIDPLDDTIGQERAISAMELALDLDAPGYNLFVAVVAEILPGAHEVEVQWQLTDKQADWGGIGFNVLSIATVPLVFVHLWWYPPIAPVTKHELHQVGRTTLSLNAGAGHTYELAWMPKDRVEEAARLPKGRTTWNPEPEEMLDYRLALRLVSIAGDGR